MIEKGCFVNEEYTSDTPLGLALRYSKNCHDLEVIKVLVDFGADVNETIYDHDQSSNPISFLDFAIKHEDEELKNYLISKGAKTA